MWPRGRLPQRPQQPAHLEAAGVVGQGKDVRLACGAPAAATATRRQGPSSRPSEARCTAAARLLARGGEARRDRLHRVLYNRRRPHSTIGYRVPADVTDESFERFEGALSEPREVLRAA